MSEEEILTLIDTKKVWNKIFGVIYKVESMDFYRRKQGVIYTVEHKGDGSWKCTCESFQFHAGTVDVKEPTNLGDLLHENTCKHIRWIMDKERIEYVEL